MINFRFFIRIFLIYSLFLSPLNGFAQNKQAVCDNKAFLKVQQKFENSYFRTSKEDVPVHVCGLVITISDARKTRSGMHGYFYLNIGSGVSIRVVNNLDEMVAPSWPWVKKGDYVEVVGRYYYDSPRKQGIDWTHKGTGRKWPYSGYVTVNGKRYE